MKVVKIQTYKQALLFSFKEQEKINTDLTIVTTKINLEEVVFSPSFAVSNKRKVKQA